MKKKNKVPKAPNPKKKKNAFKRFWNTLTFLILLGFSGFVFYRGWIQFSIPENNYALVFTKTGGYDPELLKAGDFNWRWENLFPTNLTLHLFELPWKTSEITITGILPSGRDYASILPSEASFEFALTVSVQYRLNPDNISDFLSKEDFQYSDIENWYDDFSRHTENIVMTALTGLLKESENSDIKILEERITKELNSEFPESAIRNTTALSWALPDIRLYNETRSIYLAGIEASRAYTSELEKQNAELASQLSSKMELLKDYGQILTDYPVLLQYFNLEKEKIDPMIFNWDKQVPPEPEP